MKQQQGWGRTIEEDFIKSSLTRKRIIAGDKAFKVERKIQEGQTAQRRME